MDIHLVGFCKDCGGEKIFVDRIEAEKIFSCCKKETKKKPIIKKAKMVKNTILNIKQLKFKVLGKTVSKSNSYGLATRGKFAYMYKKKPIIEYENRVIDASTLAVNKYKWYISEQPLKVSIKVYMPDNRRRDLDNVFKATLDSMQDIVYYDDRQIVEIHAKRFVDRDNPRIELVIKEL